MKGSAGPWVVWGVLALLGSVVSCSSTRHFADEPVDADAGASDGGASPADGSRSGSAGASGKPAGGSPATGDAGTGADAGAGAGGEAGAAQVDCADMTCAPGATCITAATPNVCECKAGYTDPNGDATVCKDVDECTHENGGCDPLTLCTNSPGSYSCGSCPTGYTGNGKAGCQDVDECVTSNGGCDPLVTCTNTGGSHKCGTCPHGYSGSGDSGCTDIDECATNNGGCDAATTCKNTAGSFKCGDCPVGYTGGGASGCTDINECATSNGGCDPLSKCTNTAGGFSCGVCPAGYSGTGATGCVDINECSTNNGGCSANATCSNSAGSFSCACKSGYTGNGTTCTDVNECTTNNGGCNANATCTNTPGSNTCACKSGYSGDGLTCVCGTAPGVPKPLSPYRGAYTGSMRAPAARKALRPTFAFSTVSSTCGAVTYELQVDNSCTPGNLDGCAFSSPEVSVTGLTSPTYTPTTDLPVSSTAPVGAFDAWRVRACDVTKVCSAWSAVASLHVGRVREDINGDGYGDVVILTGSAPLQVYYGASSPNFAAVSVAAAVANTDMLASFIGDVDGDGYGDLGIQQTYAPTSGYVPVVVFGGATLTARSPLVLTKSSAGSSLNLKLHPAGDFNGDGFDDFLVDFKYFDPKTELQVFYGAVQPANQAALHIPCNFVGYQLASNGLGDLNRDGYPDIGLAEQGTVGSSWLGRIAIFAGASSPSTTPVADITRATGEPTLLYPASDLDGDGYGDAVAVENGVGLVLYKGAASFSQSIWKTIANTDTKAGLGGFDMNGDGYGDLELTGTTASIYLGGASGPSTASPFPTARAANTFAGASVSDNDGDGFPDMVGPASGGALWCSSSGVAQPTCSDITNNGAAYTSSYDFAR